jgi:hypothetical protein
MTTNVYDGHALKMATDSRWSVDLPDSKIMYVDDSGYDKLLVSKEFGIAIMFAGASNLIDLWKNWVTAGIDLDAIPPVDHGDLAVCLHVFALGSGQLVLARQVNVHSVEQSIFAGSGGHYALSCWQKRRCAITAVNTAKMFDEYSGGSVCHADLRTGEHNAVGSSSHIEMLRLLEEGGVVMSVTARNGFHHATAIPANELSADEMAMVKADLKSGKLIPTAPCASMYVPWSESDKHNLVKAFTEIKAGKYKNT